LLIIFSGLPGVGKSTIAHELARALGAVHVRIDSIEQAIRAWGIADMEDLGYRVGYAMALDNLRLGLVVVADSVNPIELTREAWRAVARDAGVASLDVEVVCSDADEHRRRAESRPQDIQGHVHPTWAEVSARDYRPWTDERLVIDTAVQDVAASVAQIRAALPG
jgi:predicted kinase